MTLFNAGPGSPEADSAISAVFAGQRETAIGLRTSAAPGRITKLRKLESAILEHRKAIHAALADDLHKPGPETDLSEIMPVMAELRHAIRNLKSWMKTCRVATTVTMLGTTGRIRHEPRGVALIISPWNYPINLTFCPLVSAIAAGDTAILKPSELTPRCSALIAEIVRQVFDPAEIAVFEGDAAVSTALLDLPFDHIFFTGSPATGKLVMTAAAKHLASVTLELGGKSPVIVDESANLDKTAASLIWAKFSNSGQTCIAPDYLYVHENVRAVLAEKMVSQIAKMFGADPRRSADYGRIVNDRHFERIKRLLDDAVSRGASVLAGGDSAQAEKFIAPTLLAATTEASLLMQEEIFGPILPILSYWDITEPIRTINSRPKPLALYIYSKNQRNIDRIVSETSSGGVAINASLLQFLHNNLPFGGVNHSGLGSSHGYFGFKAFSHERAVLRDHASLTPILFPPYSDRVKRVINLMLRFFV